MVTSESSTLGDLDLGLSTGDVVPGHLQHLLETYVASYNDDLILNMTRMDHAKSLAFALLKHYYPESEGYIVQPSALGPMARYGFNFMLKGIDGSDPNYTPLPPKKGQKKGKKRRTKAQLTAEYKREVNHWWPFTTDIRWHSIDPKDIIGFQVLQKSGAEYRPYTYLGIMIDDLQTLPNFAENNDVHRGDILVDIFSMSAKIQLGYGILLFGTRLEFYDFDNGEKTRFGEDGKTITVEEPTVRLCKNANNEELVIDLRSTGVQMVGSVLRQIVKKDVKFLDEGCSDGSERVDKIAENRFQHTDDDMGGVEE
jgi:hypothetical protein